MTIISVAIFAGEWASRVYQGYVGAVDGDYNKVEDFSA
jgi:hypothetical protein